MIIVRLEQKYIFTKILTLDHWVSHQKEKFLETVR